MISSMKGPRRRNAQFDLTYLLEPLRQSQANNTSSNDEDGLGISHIALNNFDGNSNYEKCQHDQPVSIPITLFVMGVSHT